MWNGWRIMMLPELQDLADFDAPAFGQDLPFLETTLEDTLLDEELGAVEPYFGPGRSGQAKLRAWRTAKFRKKAEAKKARSSGGTKKRAPLEIIRGKGRKRRYPTRKPKPTRDERIRGALEAGLPEKIKAGLPDKPQIGSVDPRHIKLAREDALNAISKRFRADIMPKLNAIYKMVDQGSLQTSATNEHNVIMNTQAYRRKVLNDIARISARLPKGHPLRNKLAARRRSLGLY